MKVGLLALEASHIFYLVAASRAWKKGYHAFAIALFAMVAVSMINHAAERSASDTSALEWFEKTTVIFVGTFALAQFAATIDAVAWALLGGSLVFFMIGHSAYYQTSRMGEYYAAHTLWHLGTGYALLRVVESAP